MIGAPLPPVSCGLPAREKKKAAMTYEDTIAASWGLMDMDDPKALASVSSAGLLFFAVELILTDLAV